MRIVPKRAILSGAIGNLLDVYDVSLIYAMANYIIADFFPPNGEKHNLLKLYSLILFACIVRPISSICVGMLADKYGRKRTLLYTICLMGISSTLLGLLPTYHYIGAWALILFFVLRVGQNLSFGGEYISSVSYLIESGDPERQGYWGSWATVGNLSGALLCTLVSLGLDYLIQHHYAPHWAWRFAVFVSLFGVVLGLSIRKSSPESLEFILERAEHEPPTNRSLLKTCYYVITNQRLKVITLFFIFFTGVSFTYMILVAGPNLMVHIANIPLQRALILNCLLLIVAIGLSPVFGKISDKIGREPILLIAVTIILMMAHPYYAALQSSDHFRISLLHILIGIPGGMYFGPALVYLIESFPIRYRCTVASIIYSLTASLFAAISPYLALRLMIGQVNISPALILEISSSLVILSLSLLMISKRKKSLRIMHS